jgi:hypothetical protein
MQWIKSKDQLPKVNGKCLVIYPTEVEMAEFFGDYFSILDEDIDIDHVSFWMPLPNPPCVEET